MSDGNDEVHQFVGNYVIVVLYRSDNTSRLHKLSVALIATPRHERRMLFSGTSNMFQLEGH